jgi:triacylglycerol lipase
MNIILVHGILGLGKIGSLSYFNGIEEHLQSRFGARILTVKLDPAQSIKERAEQLRAQILTGLKARFGESSGLDPAEATHIIAHSMGGLDSRYLLSPKNERNLAPLITSLTTIGTPHRGSPLADFFFQFFDGANQAAVLKNKIRKTLEFFEISTARLHDLTTPVLHMFDRDYYDHSDVRYFWTAGIGRSGSLKTANPLAPAYEFIHLQGKAKNERCNDGAVTLASAMHGEAIGKPWLGDHFDLVGHDLNSVLFSPDDRPTGFNYLEKYDEIMEKISPLIKLKIPMPGLLF